MIRIKTDEEIKLMREACKITGDVLKLIEDKIKVGMTTMQLDKIAYDYITSCGAKPSFLGLYGFPATRNSMPFLRQAVSPKQFCITACSRNVVPT